MVTAEKQRSFTSPVSANALAQPLRRPAPTAPPRERAIPRSRRREYQATMTALIVASGLLLALGVLSLYGRICQTREINRRSYLNAQLKLERQRAEELTLRRARSENDKTVADIASRFNMIRRTDRDAVTIPIR
jgi:hypothetical protein